MKHNPFEMAQEALKDDDPRFGNTDLQRQNSIVEGIKLLQNPKNIFLISDFTPRQISLLIRIRVVGQWWQIPQYEEVAQMFGEMVLSQKRGSRKEAVQVMIGMGQKKTVIEGMADKIKGKGD
jgi:hypothetical protein